MRNTRLKTSLLVLLGLMLAPGCEVKTTKTASPSTQPMAELRDLMHAKRMVAPPPATTMLASSGLPLVYTFGFGGPVKVYDATVRTQVWSATVPPDAIILIDTGGVLVKGERVLARPLDSSHRYELWYEP